jgi:hypothetical protein
MRSRCCPCVCGGLCIPLSLLGNGTVKKLLVFVRQWLGKNPPIVARQRLVRNVTAVTNTRSNRRIVGPIVFNVARVVSMKVGD